MIRDRRAARNTAMSSRQLSTQFNQELRIRSKTLANLRRFDHVLAAVGAEVRAGRRSHLAMTAHECGFFDQPHLVGDFRRCTDTSPTVFWADEFPNIQDGPTNRAQTGAMNIKDTTVEVPAPTVWPTLQARDARALIDWLVGLGFEETFVYSDGGAVVHAQLWWPEGGSLMLADHSVSGDCSRQTGAFGAHVVTDHVENVYERAKAAGARIVSELAEQHHGKREFTVADPEGNVWSFGSYRGEPRKS